MTVGEVMLWFNMMFPLVFSAGPGNIMLASFGANFGLKKTIPFLLGFDFVTLVLSLSIGFFANLFIEEYPDLFLYVKMAGSVYLIYLAYKIYQSDQRGQSESNQKNNIPTFVDGAILQLLNIKSIAAISVMFSSFLDPHNINHAKVITLSFLLLFLAIFCHVVWIYCGQWMARRLLSKRAYKMQNYIFSIMLIGVAFWMLL